MELESWRELQTALRKGSSLLKRFLHHKSRGDETLKLHSRTKVKCVGSHHGITEGSSSVHQAKKYILGSFYTAMNLMILNFLHLLMIFGLTYLHK
ncbi:psbQ-like protein 3 [Pyrus ussuriensis x Pyrus communis]|uniref:PsbQ-like protein 3 n=1 Tax=Pyrus ussuriensis x Pyrus communis TaxID=2448454 RepID=A0A5N5G9I4_9ROSA|nr:psbQ-like protein 3 [Pyrus ussuriensis x Pyrus communis]